MRPDGPRPKIVGPDSGPEPPFPFRMKGKVVSGFGRGSKDLGIPTANIPVDAAPWIETVECGVYFGWASIQLPPSHPTHPYHPSSHQYFSTENPDGGPLSMHKKIYVPEEKRKEGWVEFPMVMSIGYNPFYKNTIRSAEVHVLYKFPQDFYGSEMALSVLGFIRPEYDYVSMESLIADINEDIEVTKRSLDREGWRAKYLDDPFMWGEEPKKV